MDLTNAIVRMVSDADFRIKCLNHGMSDLFNNYVIDQSGNVITKKEYEKLEQKVKALNYFMSGLDFVGQAVRA